MRALFYLRACLGDFVMKTLRLANGAVTYLDFNSAVVCAKCWGSWVEFRWFTADYFSQMRQREAKFPEITSRWPRSDARRADESRLVRKKVENQPVSVFKAIRIVELSLKATFEAGFFYLMMTRGVRWGRNLILIFFSLSLIKFCEI